MNGDPDLFDQVVPEGANVELCKGFFEQLEWAEHTFVDREHGLCTFSLLPSPFPPFPHLPIPAADPSSPNMT